MPPYLLLSLLVGAVYGALFHLWWGKTLRGLLLYMLTGMIGFGLGQALGALLGFNVGLMGQIHSIEATLVSWGSLFLVRWLKS
jgi:uncharacterized membrane protein YeaQ/YmgE (transglycosylase-associated protein family)